MQRASRASVTTSFQKFERCKDLAGLSMTPELRLLEDRGAVGDDLESTAARGDKFDARVGKPLLDLGRQPGSPWFVASEGAVFDRDFHVMSLRRSEFRVPSSGCGHGETWNWEPRLQRSCHRSRSHRNTGQVRESSEHRVLTRDH